ncbi:DUF3971 domain-containing protein [Gammaproteobacteria bacterium]|nr:DUF3971 domain-containing protein [Gammaproteobacteria bacterium]
MIPLQKKRIVINVLKSLGWFVLLLPVLYLTLFKLYFLKMISNGDALEKILLRNGLDFVRIEEVHGGWVGYDPKITIYNGEARLSPRTLISLDKLDLRVDFWGTLLNMSPMFSAAEVEGLSIYSEISPDREFSFGSNELAQFPSSYFSNIFKTLGYLKVSNVSFEVNRFSDSWIIKSQIDKPWVLEEGDRRSIFSLPLTIERWIEGNKSSSTNTHLNGTLTGNPDHPSFSVLAHFGLVGFEVAPFSDVVEKYPFIPLKGAINSQFWLSLGPDEYDISADLELNEAVFGNSVSLETVSGRAQYLGKNLANGSLKIEDLVVKSIETVLEIPDLEIVVDRNNDSESLAVFLPSTSVEDLLLTVDFVKSFSVIPKKTIETFESFKMKGQIRDLIVLSDKNSSFTRVVTNFSELEIEKSSSFPKIKGFNGFLNFERSLGYLDFYNEDFSVDLGELFPDVWSFSEGRGRLAYEIDGENIKLRSGLLKLKDGNTDGSGKFSLTLNDNDALKNWGLVVGVTGGNLEKSMRFIPKKSTKGLRGWLKSSNLSGVGKQIGITVHGAFGENSPGIRKSHDVFVSFDGLSLDYAKNWPRVENAIGTMNANSYYVSINNANGILYNTDLQKVSLLLPLNRGNRIEEIQISILSDGPLNDGIQLLRDTPLNSYTRGFTSTWKGEGNIISRTDLVIPITVESSETKLTTQIDLHDNFLLIEDLDLNFSDLSGSLNFSNRSGFYAENLKAKLFNSQIQGAAVTENLGGSRFVLFKAAGSVRSDDAYQWTGQPLLYKTSGNFNYDLNLYFPLDSKGDDLKIEFSSNLVGLKSYLPQPFDKPESSEKKIFSYKKNLRGSEVFTDLIFGDSFRAKLKSKEGGIVGGQVLFSDIYKTLNTDRPLEIKGTLPNLDIDSWISTLSDLPKLGTSQGFFDYDIRFGEADIKAENLIAGGISFANTQIGVTRNLDSWTSFFSNERLIGQLELWDKESKPMAIHLDRLILDSIPSEKQIFSGGDKPSLISKYSFSSDLIRISGKEFKDVSFEYSTGNYQSKLSQLSATFGSLTIDNALVSWNSGIEKQTSFFKGNFEISNLTEAKDLLNFTSALERGELAASAELSWEGNPTEMNPKIIEGQMIFQNGSGRFVQEQDQPVLKFLSTFHVPSLFRRMLGREHINESDQGFNFTDLEGKIRLDKGKVSIQEPLIVRASGGKFKFGGYIDWERDIVDTDLIVTLPVGNTFPWAGLVIGGPLSMAGVLATQKFLLEDRFDQLSSAKYKISGRLDSPDFEFISIFDDDVRDGKN